MQALFLEKEFTYDGRQLHSLWGYFQHRISGDSIISWIGPCQIPFSHMVDGEDLLARSEIRGDRMLHFVIEIFDRNLFSAVALQRLLAAIVKDELEKISPKLNNKRFIRKGDDLFLEEKKLSISIASSSPVSEMIHFALNVSNQGTPVPTLSLEDLEVEPRALAEKVMQLFCSEYLSIVAATRKVRPLS
ncbi:MAG: DUF366 family protein [Bdellovibrionaceae bacterium]|nr:DUF366 family protein [Pseudobdellovibrionaceae bacterium]